METPLFPRGNLTSDLSVRDGLEAQIRNPAQTLTNAWLNAGPGPEGVKASLPLWHHVSGCFPQREHKESPVILVCTEKRSR